MKIHQHTFEQISVKDFMSELKKVETSGRKVCGMSYRGHLKEGKIEYSGEIYDFKKAIQK